MLYVNDLNDTVRTFLAERTGTATAELIEICRKEGDVRASNAVSVLLTEKTDLGSIDQAQDHLAAAKGFFSVADRLESGELI